MDLDLYSVFGRDSFPLIKHKGPISPHCNTGSARSLSAIILLLHQLLAFLFYTKALFLKRINKEKSKKNIQDILKL